MADDSTLPSKLSQKLREIMDRVEAEPEPEEDKTSVPKSRRQPTAQAFEALDRFEDYARAGATDAWLQTQTQLPLTTITRWRRERGISRSSLYADADTMEAVDVFKATEAASAVHYAESSPVQGQWRPPEILLRRPLDYDALCRFLHVLTRELGISPETLAAGFGLKALDVENALALYHRHLVTTGKPCRACGELTDPKTGFWCSVRCRKAP